MRCPDKPGTGATGWKGPRLDKERAMPEMAVFKKIEQLLCFL
jgi:hypothetical protein